MKNTAEIIGSCPLCGDDLYMLRTKSGSRLVKCLNEDCVMAIKPYFLPKAGHIEPMGEECPINQYPVIKITPLLHTKSVIRPLKKQTYYWAKGPCFACKKICANVKEWMLEDNPEEKSLMKPQPQMNPTKK